MFEKQAAHPQVSTADNVSHRSLATSRTSVLDRLDRIQNRVMGESYLSKRDRDFVLRELGNIRRDLGIAPERPRHPASTSAKLAFYAVSSLQTRQPDLAWELQLLDLELADIIE